MDEHDVRWTQIKTYLVSHPYIMNSDIRRILGVTAATAIRILSGFSAEGKLVKYREDRHWAYKLAVEAE